MPSVAELGDQVLAGAADRALDGLHLHHRL
jgi:hypothetical protein